MLLKSRKPGPQAKHTNLPIISRGSVKTGLIHAGVCTSYHFFCKDVEAIARLVHGNLEAHMEQKDRERAARRLKTFMERERKLKIRYHTDSINDATTKMDKEYHTKR